MDYKRVIKHYGGSPSKAAQALGLKHKQHFQNWARRKRIPSKWQLVIEAKTGIKADKTARREAQFLAPYINGTAGLE